MNHLGIIWDEYENNFDQALHYYQRALRLDSTDQTSINLAVGYFNNEDYEKAQHIFLQKITNGTKDYRPSYYLGLLARDLTIDLEKAADWFNQSLKIDPGNFLITMDLVDLYMNQMKKVHLIPPLLEQLSEKNPDDPVIKAYIQEMKQHLP